MSFRDADRAVTVQIGAIILLGFLVVSLSLYQATVVPDQNRRVEFEHNQRVQADIQEVRNAIHRTAGAGTSAPVSVELGTSYPSRVVAVNPGAPSGTLSTSDLGAIEVRNATADNPETTDPDYPETDDFWNGSTHTYPTKSLTYQPSYANYGNAPTTVYENGIVYNRFRSGDVARTGQPIVAGRQISLVALSGSLSRGGASTLTLDPRAVSVSTRTVSVSKETTGGNVSVFVPSRLSASKWRELLNETSELDLDADPTDGGYVYKVAERSDGVELYFEPGTTYQLKLSKVGVGSGVDDTDAAYLTSAEDLTDSPFETRRYPFVVESRDKYNNPVKTQVTATAKRGDLSSGTVLEAGRYRYEYTAPGVDNADWVNVSYLSPTDGAEYDISDPAFNGSKVENVQYGVAVQAASGGDTSETTAITITTFDIKDKSNKNKLNVDINEITAEDSDGDNDLTELKVELIDGDGTVLAEITETGGSGSLTVQDENFKLDKTTGPYVLRATATDADGNVQEEEQSVG